MSLIRWTLAATTWFLATTAVDAQDVGEPDPLFQSNDVLEVRIIAPISTLLSDRPFDEELPGKFQFTNSAGELTEFEIGVRTRGKFRRQEDICKFPPLRINFKTSQTRKTLFHKQDKVKLVTHCQSSTRYESVLLREYVAYRILNTLTDVSFRVRLLRITYVDTEDDNDEDVHYGFIIEHRERLAKRLHKPVLEIQKTRVAKLDPRYLNLVSVYHYLIGNTDFSPVLALPGLDCCHNHVLFGVAGEPIWSVPYDFDQAGLINAPHAGANPRFRLRSVKQRLYRGRCVNNGYLDATFAIFRDRQGDILKVIDEQDSIGDRVRKSISSYVLTFYKTLESERRVRSQLVRKCI